MNFLDKYIISLIQLVTLLMLSPAFTNLFQENVAMYLLLVLIISIGNFFLEAQFNRQQEDHKKKAKTMGVFTIPLNTVIVAVFVLFIF